MFRIDAMGLGQSSFSAFPEPEMELAEGGGGAEELFRGDGAAITAILSLAAAAASPASGTSTHAQSLNSPRISRGPALAA